LRRELFFLFLFPNGSPEQQRTTSATGRVVSHLRLFAAVDVNGTYVFGAKNTLEVVVVWPEQRFRLDSARSPKTRGLGREGVSFVVVVVAAVVAFRFNSAR
jgi:hypothetical protein